MAEQLPFPSMIPGTKAFSEIHLKTALSQSCRQRRPLLYHTPKLGPLKQET